MEGEIVEWVEEGVVGGQGEVAGLVIGLLKDVMGGVGRGKIKMGGKERERVGGGSRSRGVTWEGGIRGAVGATVAALMVVLIFLLLLVPVPLRALQAGRAERRRGRQNDWVL